MNMSLRMSDEMMTRLERHLFPGDGDEHGAVLAASVVETPRGVRLLAHELFLARDGVHYVPGQRGYRMLTAAFVAQCAAKCADLGMAYLAIHCHHGTDSVRFSSADMASHERGYGALLDIVDGAPVGGLVFARNAVAGDIWMPDGTRRALDELVVAGRPIRVLRDRPQRAVDLADETFDRQARLFGDRGQEVLQKSKVGLIGLGGAGSLIFEQLYRLGVGHIVLVDPDRIEPSNVSRIVGSRVADTRPTLTHRRIPRRIRTFFEQLRPLKVRIAARELRRSGLKSSPRVHALNVTRKAAADDLIDCDYLFLAADSAQARLVFNALVHQYLIPGVQVGAKAQIDQESGAIVDLFSVVRPLVPGKGCMWCNGLISPSRLQEEALTPEQRQHQRYVDDPDLHDPSVITLNAVAASHATNDFLLTRIGLLEDRSTTWLRILPREGFARDALVPQTPGRDRQCRECSPSGRLGRGPTQDLPTSIR